MNPFLLMAALYSFLAGLFAFDTTLANLDLVPWFNGLRWLRIHFVSLGLLVEIAFGILPTLVAIHAKKSRPATRWDIWVLLNVGFIALGVGLPLVNAAIIFAGGTLIFLAGILLFLQLRALAPALGAAVSGRPFYLAGIAFLLLGIIFGTGLWLGWGEWLHAASPREVHLHANLWGFTSLTFAGLLIDLYPGFANRPLASPRLRDVMLGLFVIGDSALVAAPWLGINALLVAGILLHHTATGLLVFNFAKPYFSERREASPGLIHLLAAYAWILVGLAIVPISLFSPLRIPFSTIEAHAPLILVFGWALQFIYALAPYIFDLVLTPAQPSRLGGNWVSVLALNLGTAFILAAVISAEFQAVFDAAAFGAWGAAILLLGRDLWQRVGAANEARVQVDAPV